MACRHKVKSPKNSEPENSEPKDATILARVMALFCVITDVGTFFCIFSLKWPSEGPQGRARLPKDPRDAIRKSRFRNFSDDFRDLCRHPTLELDYGESRKHTNTHFFCFFFRLRKRDMFRFPTLELDFGEPRFLRHFHFPRFCFFYRFPASQKSSPI